MAARARALIRVCLGLFATAILTESGFAQAALTWQQVRDKFETANPTLLADQLNIDESKAEEITAFLRPNPGLTLSTDGTQLTPHNGAWVPLLGTEFLANGSYLHERDHKRELRLKAQQDATTVAVSTHRPMLERNLLFNLRGAFVSTLEAKAVYQLAKDDLAYYDKVLQISRDTFSAGGIAQIDLDRLELQRVQYESDLEAADVNLRTSKIQLLTLLNDRTPIEQFDVTGTYDFNDQLLPRDDFRKIALDTRPDLKAAVESIVEAQTNHTLAVPRMAQLRSTTSVARGIRITLHSTIRMTTRRSGPALASPSASSTAIRERSFARNSTSRCMKGFATPPRSTGSQRC